MHYIAMGLILGSFLPILALYLFQIIDSKVKSEHLLTSKMKVPVLASIDMIRNDVDIRRENGSRVARVLFYMLTMSVIATLAYLRINQQG